MSCHYYITWKLFIKLKNKWQRCSVGAKKCDKSTFQIIVNLIKKKHTLFNNKIRQIFCVCFKISEREINSCGVLPHIHRDCIDFLGLHCADFNCDTSKS